jgi:hypothetical protein
MDIRTAIKEIAMAGTELYLRICTVDSVDEGSRTVECTPIDEGAPLTGVNLQSNQGESVGLVLVPTVGSEVTVGFINEAVAVVVQTASVDKVILTIGKTELTIEDGSLKLGVGNATLEMTDDGQITWSGDNGGSETTANATELQKQLQTMSGRIDAIIRAIMQAAVSPMDGGATFKANLTGALSSYLGNKEDFSQMIDNKIKH